MDNFINIATKISIVLINSPEFWAFVSAAGASLAHTAYKKIQANKDKNKVLEWLAKDVSEEEIANHVRLTLAQIKKIAEEKAAKK
jgi:hypothetical protein